MYTSQFEKATHLLAHLPDSHLLEKIGWDGPDGYCNNLLGIPNLKKESLRFQWQNCSCKGSGNWPPPLVPPKGTRLETELRAVDQCTPELMQEASRDSPLESDPAVTITDPGAAPPTSGPAATTATVTWWIELIMHCAVQVKCSHWSSSSSSKSIRTLYTHCKLSIVQHCCRITHWPIMIPKLLQHLHINPGSQSKHLQDQNQSSTGERRKLPHWMFYTYILHTYMWTPRDGVLSTIDTSPKLSVICFCLLCTMIQVE